MTHMLFEFCGNDVAVEQALPVGIGAQTATVPAAPSGSAHQPFDGINLSGPDTNEVAAAG